MIHEVDTTIKDSSARHEEHSDSEGSEEDFNEKEHNKLINQIIIN